DAVRGRLAGPATRRSTVDGWERLIRRAAVPPPRRGAARSAMERVAFLVDATGERIDCLLHPESLEVRRLAGVRTRTSAGGQLVGAGLADDPLLFTGGGRTELVLDLLFDVELVEAAVAPHDVRELT